MSLSLPKLPSELGLASALVLASCGSMPSNETTEPERTPAQIISGKLHEYAYALLSGPLEDDKAGRCRAEELEGTNRYTFFCQTSDAEPYIFTFTTNDGLGCAVDPSTRDDTRFPPASIYATDEKFRASFRLSLGENTRCDNNSCNGQKLTPSESDMIVDSGRYLCKAVGKLIGEEE